jgi:hypothetical protein
MPFYYIFITFLLFLNIFGQKLEDCLNANFNYALRKIKGERCAIDFYSPKVIPLSSSLHEHV